MAHGFRTILRSIVPNANFHIHILRIGADWTERLPLVAWDVHIEEVTPVKGVPFESVRTTPVTIEETPTNAIDLVVGSDGRAYNLDTQSWETVKEAIADCQRELAEQGDK